MKQTIFALISAVGLLCAHSPLSAQTPQEPPIPIVPIEGVIWNAIEFYFDFGRGDTTTRLHISENTPSARLNTPDCLAYWRGYGLTDQTDKNIESRGIDGSLTVSNPYRELRAYPIPQPSATEFRWKLDFYAKKDGKIAEHPGQTYTCSTRYRLSPEKNEMFFQDFTIEGDGQFTKLKRRFECQADFSRGTAAKAEVRLSNGYPVKSVIIKDGGLGNTDNAKITFRGGYRSATGTVSADPNTGAITAVNLTQHGEGYFGYEGYSMRYSDSEEDLSEAQKEELRMYMQARSAAMQEAIAQGNSPIEAMRSVAKPSWYPKARTGSAPSGKVHSRPPEFAFELDTAHESPEEPTQGPQTITLGGIEVRKHGRNYSSQTEISFQGDCKIPAKAKLIIDPKTGSIRAAMLRSHGDGYKALPTVVIKDPEGRGEGAEIVAQTSAFGSGRRLIVTLLSPGSGYAGNAPEIRLYADGKIVDNFHPFSQLTQDGNGLASISFYRKPPPDLRGALRLEIAPPPAILQGNVTTSMTIYADDGETILSRCGHVQIKDLGNGEQATFDFTQGPAGKMVKGETIVSKKFPFGMETYKHITHCYLPDGSEDPASTVTVSHLYYDRPEDGKIYGERKGFITSNNGPWEYVGYGPNGMQNRIVSQYLSSSWDGVNPPPDKGNYVHENSEANYEDYAFGNRHGPANVKHHISKTDGVVTEENIVIFWLKENSYPGPDGGFKTSEMWTVEKRGPDDASALVTINESFVTSYDKKGISIPNPRNFKTRRETTPDGETTLYDYDEHTQTVSRGVLNAEGNDIVSGEITVTQTDDRGNTVSEKKFYRTLKGTFEQTEREVLSLDEYSRPLVVRYKGDPTHTVSYTYGKNSVTEVSREGTTIVRYDTLGREISRTENGKTTSYELDPAGRNIGTSINGKVVSQNAYDSLDRVHEERERVQDALMTRKYRYFNTPQYDIEWRSFFNSDDIASITETYKDGSLHRVYGPESEGVAYDYKIAPDGNRVTALTRLNAEGFPQGLILEQTIDWSGRVLSVKTPSMAKAGFSETASFYDSQGRLCRTSQTGAPDILYAYNERGQLIKTARDLNGDGKIGPGDTVEEVSLSYVRDPYGRASRVEIFTRTNPDGSQRSLKKTSALDGGFSALEIMGRDGAQTTTDSRPEGVVQTTRFSNGWVLRTVTRGNLPIRQVFSDAQGKTISSEELRYDNAHRLVERILQKDGRTQTWRYAYYDDGTLRSCAEGSLTPTLFERTPRSKNGFAAITTSPEGRVRIEYFTPQGFLSGVGGDARFVRYTRDAEGHMLTQAVRRAPGEDTPLDLTRWTYENGVPVRRENPDGGTVAYAYGGSAGRIQSITLARGVVRRIGYDAQGRTESLSYSDGTPAVVQQWSDSLPFPVEIADASGTRTLSGCPQGSPCPALWQYREGPLTGIGARYAFNPQGCPLSFTLLPETLGGWQSVYAKAGSLTSLQARDPWGRNICAKYYRSPSGELNSLTVGLTDSRPILAFSYMRQADDKIDRLTMSRTDNTVMESTNYLYDADGLCTQESTYLGWTWKYTYNRRGELVEASAYNQGFAQNSQNVGRARILLTYAYDEAGNRTESKDDVNYAVYETLPGNAYKGIARGIRADFYAPKMETFTYDADGNRTGDRRWTYVWDGENRLVGMEEKSGDSRLKLAFTYDSENRRVQKRVWRTSSGGQPELVSDLRFVYDGPRLARVLDGRNTNAPLQSFLWDTEGRPLAFSTPQALFFYRRDAMGSIREVIAANGQSEGSYLYGPFGERLDAEKTPPVARENPLRYAGMYQDDETGLYLDGAAYYAPDEGRWLNPQDENALNGYLFSDNAPAAPIPQ